jgi:hypothetical protein
MIGAMRLVIAGVVFSLTLSGTLAVNAATKFVPPTAQQDVSCMVKVLKAMPGIDRVKSGFSKEATSGSPAGLRHRFVEYHFIDKAGFEYYVRFNGTLNDAMNGHEYGYVATLPNGVIGRPSDFNDWGTSRVIDSWKAHCGIAAGALSF